MKKLILGIVHGLFKIQPIETLFVYFLSMFPTSFLQKLAPTNDTYSKKEVRNGKRNGINYQMYLYDYMQWSLYFYNQRDSSLGLLDYVKTGNVVFDIGGNIGQTSFNVALKTGSAGKIYTFEPFYENFERLSSNLKLNPQFSNITIENLALGSEVSTVKMYKDCETNSGGNRVLPETLTENESNIVEVPVTTLDLYCEKHNIKHIDVIKIDVEGYEMAVLKGAVTTLKTLGPQLYVEVGDKKLKEFGSSADELIAYIAGFGYTIYDPQTNKAVKKYADLSPECFDIYCKK